MSDSIKQQIAGAVAAGLNASRSSYPVGAALPSVVVAEVTARILPLFTAAQDGERERGAGLDTGDVTCKMFHEPPMDFAYCETHDDTFPLGGRCKFYGREMWEVCAEEADEQRGLKVRAEMELERTAAALDAARAAAAAAQEQAAQAERERDEAEAAKNIIWGMLQRSRADADGMRPLVEAAIAAYRDEKAGRALNLLPANVSLAAEDYCREETDHD